MLVVSNGAFKSGSTWLYWIAKLITNFGPPPLEYLNSEWVNPSIKNDKLASFLREGDYHTQDYLCKNHFSSKNQRDLLLSKENVIVLGITRNLKDVVVSAYYHHRRTKTYDQSFKEYYWTHGRKVADSVRKYNLTWDVSSPYVFITRYKLLLNQFDEEVMKIADKLGFALSKKQLKSIARETDFGNWKERTGSDHLRKGKLNDWMNHMDSQMINDMNMIERKGLPAWSRLYTRFRRYLNKSVKRIHFL